MPLSDKLYRKTDYFVMMVESETTTSRSSSTNGKYGGGTKHNSSELWLFDTGASVHVTPSDKFLFNPQFKRVTVRVAEGTVVQSPKQGDLLLQSNCGAQLRLTGVLVIPSFTKNIISGSKLVQNNSQEIKISANGVKIIHEENTLHMVFNPSTQLWYMNGTRMLKYMNYITCYCAVC
jgi:hypothetical protein